MTMNIFPALSLFLFPLLLSSQSCLALTLPPLRGCSIGGIADADGGIGRRRSSPSPRRSSALFGHQSRAASISINDLIPGNSRASSSSSAHQHQLSMVGGSYSPEPEQPEQQITKQQRWAEYIEPDLEVPTITQAFTRPPAQIPPRPKIVVFGASGRIGRRVLKRLLNSGIDADVVAFVRNATKLEKVLYDEEDLVLDNLLEDGDKKTSGPKLKVVVGDVVSRRDVYQKRFETDEEKRALDDWVGGARRYFKKMGWKDYDGNSTDIKSYEDDARVASDVDTIESGGDEALKEVISGATVLISCLGTFRPSELWVDYLRAPVLRVFRRDASKWCSNPAHPFYVNYLSTAKILREAEDEQARREAVMEFERERVAFEEQLEKGKRARLAGKEEEGFESEIAARLATLRKKRSSNTSANNISYNSNNNGDVSTRLPKNSQLSSATDRIKFIRISNLMVGRSPFRISNVLTNILWSQPSKFELMGETLMESTTTIDTIALRPGTLVDDERNANHTSLQLRIDGKVDAPSVVGREDVADLAVVSALAKTTLANETSATTNTPVGNAPLRNSNQNSTNVPATEAHHYTWAVRWTGQYLSPPQGLRPDGLGGAALCFVEALREQARLAKMRRTKEGKLKSFHGGKELLEFDKWRRTLSASLFLNTPFVHSLAVSIPVYATVGVISWYLLGQTLIDLFGRMKQLQLNSMPQLILKLLPK